MNDPTLPVLTLSVFDLILPILLSAVFVFIASSIIHMFLPIHKSDFKKLSGEDKVLDALRSQSPAPGEYMFPGADSMKEMGSPEMLEKYKRGPVGFMTVMPNAPFPMGKSLRQWMILCVVISFFVGYAASIAYPKGAEFMPLFRFTFIPAILGYAISSVQNSIWKGVSWCVTAKFLFDGLVYALVTAATFGWLWPSP